nr:MULTISPECIES: CHAT domain-containing protein [unclassified Limnothrix]
MYESASQVAQKLGENTIWLRIQNNLALLYKNKGERYIYKAIKIYENILSASLQDWGSSNAWAIALVNLSDSYTALLNLSSITQEEKTTVAIKLIESAKKSLSLFVNTGFSQELAVIYNNLGVAYDLFYKNGETDQLSKAIEWYQKALDLRKIEISPATYCQTARNLGHLFFQNLQWKNAAESYEKVLVASNQLYTTECFLLSSQASELRKNGRVPRLAAYAYAKTGQLAKALETIERGRARGLSERLQRDRADLAQLQQQRPDLFDRYRDITNQLQNLESLQREQQVRDRQAITPEQHRNEAQKLRQDLTEAIAQIRQVPGYETFLQAPSLAEIQQNLSTEAPTVYLIPTPNGSLALIATPQAIDPLWLDAFPEATLTDLVQTWLNASRNQRNDFPGWLEAIDQGTRQLWDPLMAPLIDRLKQHNHTQAILIPTGLLGLLPLHAAWTPDPNRPTGRRYALDELTFTYAPNAQSLVAARAVANALRSNIAQRFPDSHLDSILAIDNPRQDLPSSEREVLAAVKTFPRPTVLRHEKATTATVAANLGQQAIVHFSCHGTVDFNEPLNSGLLMNDNLLTLRELFALKLTEGNKHGIRLAILSACETGLPGLDLADEAIGLPVGLLQAGVAGAIASLWAVSDLSTAILLTKFYDLWRNHHLTPPDALRQAQQWLRAATLAEIRQLTGIGLRGAEHPFTHPYYWAGFSYTGI